MLFSLGNFSIEEIYTHTKFLLHHCDCKHKKPSTSIFWDLFLCMHSERSSSLNSSLSNSLQNFSLRQLNKFFLFLSLNISMNRGNARSSALVEWSGEFHHLPSVATRIVQLLYISIFLKYIMLIVITVWTTEQESMQSLTSAICNSLNSSNKRKSQFVESTSQRVLHWLMLMLMLSSCILNTKSFNLYFCCYWCWVSSQCYHYFFIRHHTTLCVISLPKVKFRITLTILMKNISNGLLQFLSSCHSIFHSILI